MKLVIIESPYAGDTALNVAYARAAMRDSLGRGEAPLASHLLYPGTLDDQVAEERELGIAAGFAWGEKAERVAFYTNLGRSSGMNAALEHWRARGATCEERQIPTWSVPAEVATWVRARNGSFYRDPVLAFDGGHVSFANGAPLLVLWTPCATSPAVVLDGLFAKEGWGAAASSPRASHVRIPGLPGGGPPREAFVFPFHLGRRIPEPTFHGGTERHRGRIRGGHVLDFPARADDVDV